MEPIIIGILAAAILMFVMSRVMAAQNTGIVENTDKVYQGGGDPAIIYMVAEGAITPTFCVEPGSVAASEVKVCDASAEEYTGTADVNKKGGALAGTDPMTTAYATGDVIAVITGACQVLKTGGGNVPIGAVMRPDTTTAGEVIGNASTVRYHIGRSQTVGTNGTYFVMRQI